MMKGTIAFSLELLSASRSWACGAPIANGQQDTDRSDCSQRDKRQDIGAIRAKVDPEQLTDHELDV